MKLYYTPGACSHAVHVALREAGLTFELERVDLLAKTTASGADYLAVNPKGYVPALRLDDGALLTEVAVLLQYVADRKPESGLAPPAGTMARYRLQEWLNYISSELHKGLGQFFNPKLPAETRPAVMPRLEQRLGLVASQLDGAPYLMGEQYSVADSYLYTILGWGPALKVDLGAWPALGAFSARVRARPAVQAARAAEGLPA
jgi:glutathione S-transferase